VKRLATFRVGGWRYALPAELVAECVEADPVTHEVPGSGEGGRPLTLARVRGRWVPVLELADAVATAGRPEDTGAAPLLVVLGRDRDRLALRVERFEGLVEVDERARDRAASDELIEHRGELIRYIDPEALLGSRGSRIWEEEGGGSMEDVRAETEPVQVVAFRVGGEEFGVDVMKVTRVLKVPKVRPVPRSPEFVEGVVAVEGAVVPVIDMRERFSVPAAARASQGALLVVDLAGTQVGLVVDAVPGVVSLPPDAVSPAPEFFKGLAGRYLQGIAERGGRMIVLLDLDEVLTSKERIALNEMLEAGPDAAASRRPAPKGKKRRVSRKAKRKGDG
jgi:purine-binding chemotaxis protein CheW